MSLINMNYGGMILIGIYGLIQDNYKEILFDGIEENYTADYKDAPENTNYVKYTISPVIEEDNIKKEEYDEIFKKKLSEGFDGVFYNTFEWIYGLEADKEIKSGC